MHMLGWLIWLALTGLSLWSGYVVAAAFFGDRHRAERLAVALTLNVALIIGLLQVWGLFGLIRPLTVGPSAVAVFLGTALWARRRLAPGDLRSIALGDVRSVRDTFREAWVEKEPLAIASVLGAVSLATAALLVWIYKTWNYDAAVYHAAITDYLVQDGGTALQQTHSPWVKGYPINVSLYGAWNCLFQRDNRLDDSPQLIFALIAALMVAAWARRLGASRTASLGIGSLFLLLPPVMLQMPTGQVDLACAAMFTMALYFAAFSPERRDRWMFLIAFGIYVGTKFTGMFHLLLIAPVALVRVWMEFRRAPSGRARLLLDVALSLGLLMLLGSPKYFQNLFLQGNPIWPFTTRVPLVGIQLPGLYDSSIVYGHNAGRAEFFGMPGDLKRLWDSWMHTEPVVWPDVRQGGFGPLFRWLLLPSLLLLALSMIRPRNWRAGWPVLLLFALTLSVPAAWWPRYTIAAACAGLVALAIAHGQVQWRWARVLLSVGAVSLAVYGSYRTIDILVRNKDFYMWPNHFVATLKNQPRQRATLQVVDWLWPTAWNEAKEDLEPGAVVTYDESADFLSEYFTHDFHTRVVFVSSVGPASDFVQRVKAIDARWVGIRGGGAAERALQQLGAQKLFQAPRAATVLYRMP